MLIERAASAQTAFETTGLTMLASLMALAVAEHWFLVAPMNANALWGSTKRRDSSEWAATLEQELALQVEFESVEEGEPAAWSVALPQVCNSRDLANVLELVAAGGFGEIESVRGAVRTPGAWVAFEMRGARARMAPFEPRGLNEPLLIAKGRRVDRSRLHAALRRCAA